MLRQLTGLFAPNEPSATTPMSEEFNRLETQMSQIKQVFAALLRLSRQLTHTDYYGKPTYFISLVPPLGETVKGAWERLGHSSNNNHAMPAGAMLLQQATADWCQRGAELLESEEFSRYAQLQSKLAALRTEFVIR